MKTPMTEYEKEQNRLLLRERRSRRNREYYRKNQAKLKAQKLEKYHQSMLSPEFRDKERARHRRHYQDNKEKYQEKDRRYYARHQEKRCAQKRKYYAEHKDERREIIREHCRIYYTANRERILAKKKSRAAILNALCQSGMDVEIKAALYLEAINV